MKAYLTRETNVRTNNGLVPLKKLKEGDIVIAWDGDSICADTVEAVEAAAVVEMADEISTTNDTALVYLLNKVKLGDKADELDVDHLGCILSTAITGWHPKAYNDIAFRVKTKNCHNLFVGNDGKILVDCD